MGRSLHIIYAKIIILRFVEPWWFMNLSERINPFPTHTLKHFQINKLAKHQLGAVVAKNVLSSASSFARRGA